MSYPLITDKSVFENIIIATWYDIDLGDSTKVQYYYTPDAKLYFNDRDPVVGREDIHEGYQIRRTSGSGDRVSRHVITNVFVTSASENEVETICCMRLYAGNGTPPLPHPEPLSVADEIDKFVRGDDGVWLIAERHLRNLFSDPETVFREPPSSKKS